MEEKVYTTGEVAKLAQVSVRTLQYYDSIGLLVAHRESTDRRYYLIEQIQLLQSILFYKQLGVPIDTIKNYLTMDGADPAIRDVFDEQSKFIELEYLNVRLKRSAILAIQSVRAVNLDVKIPETVITDLIKTNRTIERYHGIVFSAESSALAALKNNSEAVLSIYFSWKQLSMEALLMQFNNIKPSLKFGEKWAQFTKSSVENSDIDEDVFIHLSDQSDKWPKDDRQLYEQTKEFINDSLRIYKKETK